MKIELDIKQDDIVDQIAQRLMGYVYDEEGDVDWGDEEPKHKRTTVKQMVVAAVMTRTKAAVDDVIKSITQPIIEKAVADVLEDGWYKTNSYGEKTSTKLDLKGRISEMLNERQEYERKPYIDILVKKHVDDALTKQLAPLVEQAKKSLKDQLDAGIAAKFAEVVKIALGVR
jgi:hypothetical protein